MIFSFVFYYKLKWWNCNSINFMMLDHKKLNKIKTILCPMAQWVPRWIVVHLTQVRFLVNPWFQSGKSVDCITHIKCWKTINHWAQRRCGSSNLGLLQLTRNWITSINNPWAKKKVLKKWFIDNKNKILTKKDLKENSIILV